MPRKPKQVRAGGTRLELFNSGLEVWLYDDANRDAIRTPRGGEDQGAGGMPPDFEAKTTEGLIVGYSLMQDDEIDVVVYVGAPLSEKELSVGRWLDPQVGYLKLPSGALCVEPNDGSRIGPEEPTDKGGRVKVPSGDYRLTLYRVDHEALDREELAWEGPQELIVLTPGGDPSEAASYLLPFEQRRDTSWVGKYTIHGTSADALLWFGDGWDSFVLNLDAAAVGRMKLVPGTYLRVTTPDTGPALYSVYAETWEDARRLPPPDGVPLDEYGFASLFNLQEWNGQQGMLCRRDKSKTRVEDKHQTRWLPCTVEILDARPREKKTTARGFVETSLAEKDYYAGSAEFLSLILSDVLPGVDDLDELVIADAVKRFDKELAKHGMKPVADLQFGDTAGDQSYEMTARVYLGRERCFAAVIGQEMNIHVGFWSEREDGHWTVTGLLDDFSNMVDLAAAQRPKGPKMVTVDCRDEPLARILEAHELPLDVTKTTKAPSTRAEVEEAFGRFLTTAFG